MCDENTLKDANKYLGRPGNLTRAHRKTLEFDVEIVDE